LAGVACALFVCLLAIFVLFLLTQFLCNWLFIRVLFSLISWSLFSLCSCETTHVRRCLRCFNITLSSRQREFYTSKNLWKSIRPRKWGRDAQSQSSWNYWNGMWMWVNY
jgi:hypothetical protein